MKAEALQRAEEQAAADRDLLAKLSIRKVVGRIAQRAKANLAALRKPPTRQAIQRAYRSAMLRRRVATYAPIAATKAPFDRERRRLRNRAASRSAARNRA